MINRAAKSRGKSESDTTCNTPVATGNRRGVSNAARDTETVAAADREPCRRIRFHDSEFRVLTSSLVTRRGLLIPGRTLPRRAHATPLPCYKVRFHIANTPTSIQPRQDLAAARAAPGGVRSGGGAASGRPQIHGVLAARHLAQFVNYPMQELMR